MDKKLSIIVPPQNKGWILDTTARQIAKRNTGDTSVFYSYDYIPKDSAVLAMHYSLLPTIFMLNPDIESVSVYFTHESSHIKMFVPFVNRCKSVIVSSDRVLHSLTAKGVSPYILHVVPECDDPDLWKPHRRLERKTLISQAYYDRKNPDLIFKVIEAMPHRQFLLLGKDWNKWHRFAELSALPNLEIRQDVPYEEYPAIYEECDVYFSASTLEGGGPHSLIEAMMANLVPVVSMTGNYNEYINHTYNGFYFKDSEKLENITTMLEIAYALDTDISITVRGFTWDMFAKEILDTLWHDPTMEG